MRKQISRGMWRLHFKITFYWKRWFSMAELKQSWQCWHCGEYCEKLHRVFVRRESRAQNTGVTGLSEALSWLWISIHFEGELKAKCFFKISFQASLLQIQTLCSKVSFERYHVTTKVVTSEIYAQKTSFMLCFLLSMEWDIGGSRGCQGRSHPVGSKVFNFMQFLGKIGPNNGLAPHLCSWPPFSGKS